MSDEEDCWDAFGSSSDEDDSDGDEENEDMANDNDNTQGDQMDTKTAASIAMHLSQTFLKHNPQIKLSERTVLVARVADGDVSNGDNNKCTLSKHLEQRQMCVLRQTLQFEQCQEQPAPAAMVSDIFGTFDTMVDALVFLDGANTSNPITDEKRSGCIHELIESILCPGGVLIVPKSTNAESTNHDDSLATDIKPNVEKLLVGSDHDATVLSTSSSTRFGTIDWVARHKKTIRAHASTCPWLSSSHSVAREEERLHLATVALSSHEMAASPFPSTQTARRSSKLTDHSIKKAVSNMKQYGYCILPGFLDKDECLEWSSAVLDCVHEASKILLERDGVDIYNPQSSHTEPQSYRELSMREDLRMDIRHGPALSKLRARKEGSATAGGNSIVLSATEDRYGDGLFLRGHPSLLEILRRTMNPGSASSSSSVGENEKTKPLYLGNMGRWNFGGTGNNGSYQDLRISPIGGIVSLPGSADQALHADTPHLFEHIPDLPAHYINVFAPCTAFDEAVGGTAFVHGSHNLAFTAQHYDANHNASFYPFLVRPRVSLGDVILFDCRILHFGLANTSKTVERCICYVNTWHDWFHDAKNWDKNRAIFEQENEDANEREEKR